MTCSNYSLYSLLSEYKTQSTIEKYEDKCRMQQEYVSITLIIFCVIVLWLWALVLCLVSFKDLESWAQLVALLGVISMHPIGAIVTIVVVIVGKKQMIS